MQLTDFYHPIIGGQELHVATLSREFIRLGHTCVVVTLRAEGLPAEETIDGVRVIRIRSWSQQFRRFYADHSRPFHPTAPDPGAVIALRRIIQQERPDVVHSHSWLAYSYFPLYRAQEGPAHVMALHDYGLACPRRSLLRPGTVAQCEGPKLARCLPCTRELYGVAKGSMVTISQRANWRLHGRVDRYIAVSDAVADGSRTALPNGVDVEIIPATVPNALPALAAETPRPSFLPPSDGYLMFVGALGPHKGVNVLLDAYRHMRHRLPLLLIGTRRGDTPRIDDPNVFIAHNVGGAEVMASWMRASIAVVPSVWTEPFGLVAVEAMLAGRPVVASDTGGLRDIVEHGTTGLLVRPGDPDALAEALDGLLGNPVLQRRMGDAGRMRAHQFEAQSIAPRVLEVLNDAVCSRRLAGQHSFGV